MSDSGRGLPRFPPGPGTGARQKGPMGQHWGLGGREALRGSEEAAAAAHLHPK